MSGRGWRRCERYGLGRLGWVGRASTTLSLRPPERLSASRALSLLLCSAPLTPAAAGMRIALKAAVLATLNCATLCFCFNAVRWARIQCGIY